MAQENIITSANQVELVLESGSTKRGTAKQMGRIVVDDFTVSRSEDDSLESGIGMRLPAGISYGDIEFEGSFTMLGDDVETFQMVSTQDGKSLPFSFTARKPRDPGDPTDDRVDWEVSMGFCLATLDEQSASSGDPHEWAVEFIGGGFDRITRLD